MFYWINDLFVYGIKRMAMCCVFLVILIALLCGNTTKAFSLLSDFSLHKVKLRNDDSSPYCYAATVDPTKSSISENKVRYNFLATQVWPSARQAAFFLEQYVDRTWKVCELGCGPALPSITLANLGLKQVIASDLDKVALEMIEKAAEEQGYENLFTEQIDLTEVPTDELLNRIDADLYVMSDVFENNAVATGAAYFTQRLLEHGAKVWIFAQSDRAQREIYLKELEKIGMSKYGNLQWINQSQTSETLLQDQLVLFDLDELNVVYG
jgi:predicted nicotinamide N-methyase